jgi:DNA-directed RNA polymerase subunit RPC12/RpoP
MSTDLITVTKKEYHALVALAMQSNNGQQLLQEKSGFTWAAINEANRRWIKDGIDAGVKMLIESQYKHDLKTGEIIKYPEPDNKTLLDAVDIVCVQCSEGVDVTGEDKYCPHCPVRRMIDKFKHKKV